MTPTTDKERAEQEARALNDYAKRTRAMVDRCGACEGTGKRYGAVFGDPALGYEYVGRCLSCDGTGLVVGSRAAAAMAVQPNTKE